MEIPKEVLQWKFGAIGGNLKSNNRYLNNQGYSLFCEQNKKFLIWQKGMLSINLAFSNTEQTKYHFQLPDNKEREILTGEPVAMANGLGESFLRYGKQRFGINLKWTSEPLFQWRIFTESGKKNEKIPIGAICSILNVEVEPDPDFLIYFDREIPKVVNIGWPSSPKLSSTLIKTVKKINEIRKELV